MNLGGIGRYLSRRTRRRADRARGERRWAAAAAGYRRWVEQRPGDGPIWVQLGHMLREDGDLAGAGEAYRRAADLLPQDADLLLFRGHLERELGQDDSALAFYRLSHAQDGNAQAAVAAEGLMASRSDAEAPEAKAGEPDKGDSDRESPIDEDAPAEAAPLPAPVGAVEHLDHEVVHGWLSILEDDDAVLFTADGKVVGQAWPDRDHRRGEGHEFRTLLALDGAVEVEARRRSDGGQLDGSPFLAHAGRPVAGWLGYRACAGCPNCGGQAGRRPGRRRGRAVRHPQRHRRAEAARRQLCTRLARPGHRRDPDRRRGPADRHRARTAGPLCRRHRPRQCRL